MLANSKKSEETEKKALKDKLLEVFKISITKEFLYAGIGCLAFLLLYSLLPHAYWKEIYRNIICALIVFSFFIAFIILNQPNTKKNFLQVNYSRNIILFTVLNFAILSFLFFRTDFAYSGLSPDNWYRFAYVTQMAKSGYPQDSTYKGFSAFMAPLYWYLLALLSIIFQIEPYKMIKFGFLFSYYILPILFYEVWKKIFNKKKSFYLTAFFFTFIANYSEIIWIDHLIGYMFFIPFFLYYFENYKEKDFTKNDYIVAGILGSLLVCIFYLYFILIPIYTIVCLIQSTIQKNFKIFKKKLKRIFIISILIIVFSSWFWIPLMINIINIGYENHQNNFFPSYALDMPFEAYLEFNLFSLVLILGLVFILIRYGKSKLLTILGNIILSVYILYLIGFAGLLIGFPIVHFRILVVSYYVLVISFILFYVEFFRLLKKKEFMTQFKNKINIKRVEIILFIIIIFYQNYRNTVDLYESDYYEDALNEKVPKEIKVIKELDDYKNKVFLTQYFEAAAFLPIYLFVSENSHFSHPSALYNKRVVFLQELSDCKNSKEFFEGLKKSKFGPIHYFYLEPCVDPIFLNITEFLFDAVELEYFPYRLNVKIYFRAELFENSKYFKKIIIDDNIIYKTKY